MGWFDRFKPTVKSKEQVDAERDEAAREKQTALQAKWAEMRTKEAARQAAQQDATFAAHMAGDLRHRITGLDESTGSLPRRASLQFKSEDLRANALAEGAKAAGLGKDVRELGGALEAPLNLGDDRISSTSFEGFGTAEPTEPTNMMSMADLKRAEAEHARAAEIAALDKQRAERKALAAQRAAARHRTPPPPSVSASA